MAGQIAGRPGPYPLNPGMTLCRAIAAAGGLRPPAQGEKVTYQLVRHRGDRQEEWIAVGDLNDITSGKRPDIEIQQNDRIMIVACSQVFYLFGEVQRPGVYINKADVPLTLRQVVASAGGFTVSSLSKMTCEISRRPLDGKPTRRSFELDAIMAHKAPDVEIEANDLLNVAYGGQPAPEWREEPIHPSDAALRARPRLLGRQAASAPIGVYYMSGAVWRPDAYPFAGQVMTLRRALVAAGGIDRDVQTEKLTCRIERHRPDGKQEVIAIDDVKAVLSGKKPDIEIQPSDLVVIEPPGGLKSSVSGERSPTPLPKGKNKGFSIKMTTPGVGYPPESVLGLDGSRWVAVFLGKPHS